MPSLPSRKDEALPEGFQCDGPKCPFEFGPSRPASTAGPDKESEYLLQLREKQKARRIYGVLEKQFHTYYERRTVAG